MANLWNSHTVTVVFAEPGTTDADFLTYNPDLSRIRVDESIAATIEGGPAPVGATRVIERSTDLVTWTTVRGGAEQLVDAGALPVNDFEFTANAENHYRIRVLVDGALHHTFRDSRSVVLDAIWLKAVRRPFLNRTVVVVDFGDVSRTGRSGVFGVVGRSLPVAVVDVHGSQEFELQLLADSVAAARELDLTIASGDVFYVHGPADSPLPAGYYVVGDLSRARFGRRGPRRVLTLPLTQVATPHALLESVTFTWRGLANRYATWTDVMNAHASYRSILDLIGTAGDVVIE